MQLAFRVVLLSQGWTLLSMALFVRCSLGLGKTSQGTQVTLPYQLAVAGFQSKTKLPF